MNCCENLKLSIEDDDVPLEYYEKFREYGIELIDGTEDILTIHYCPWCGTQLPSGLRDRWFEELEGRGLDIDSSNIPKELQTDAWWKKLGI